MLCGFGDGTGDAARPDDVAAVGRILSDLLAEGYLSKIKQGRRNRYTVNRTGHLRHPNFQELEIGPLIDILRHNGSKSRPREAVKRDGASPSR